jgi:Leucine-rich repeat (LRR) protein
MQTLKQLQNGELKGAVSLKLAEGLSNFPREIFELADTLEILDLSFNNLSELPADFGRLQKLKDPFLFRKPLHRIARGVSRLSLAGYCWF